jgi:hypothetical protein
MADAKSPFAARAAGAMLIAYSRDGADTALGESDFEEVPSVAKFGPVAASVFLALCSFSLAGESAGGAAPPRDGNRIGINLWFLSDWDGSFAFVDAMKHARAWQDGADWHSPVAGTDEAGWPTADASTVIYTGSPAQINGRYRLVFNGQADVSLMWAKGTISNKRYDPASNTTTADITYGISAEGSVGLIFRNTRRTARSPVNSGFANVRLFRPGYPADGSQVFTRPFLKALGKFSALRMMDWSLTNQDLCRRWSERMKPRDAARAGPSYAGSGGLGLPPGGLGVALEYQILLCNELKADFWINIPVAADDEYIRKIALALRYGTDGVEPYTRRQASPLYPPLAPGLKLYVEYANEVWNSASGFSCFAVVKDIVGSLPEGHELRKPAEQNIWALMWRYAAYRIAAISDTFRSVFGDANMMSRVRPVLMTQQGDAQATLSQALLWLDGYAHRQSPRREVDSYLYGAGGSAYYGVNSPPRDQSDVDTFFAPGNYPSSWNVKAMGIDSVWAAAFGLRHLAYEGGMGLDGFSDTNANRLNLDPRMEDILTKTHDSWSSQGGELLMYYTLCGPPQWEFTHDIGNLGTPKLKAIDELLSRNRATIGLGRALPGEIIAADQADYRPQSGYGYPVSIDGLACLGGNRPGEWLALPAHAAEAFPAEIIVKGAAASPATIDVWVNGRLSGTVSLAGGGRLVQSTALKAEIPEGLVVIRLEATDGTFQLRSILVRR